MDLFEWSGPLNEEAWALLLTAEPDRERAEEYLQTSFVLGAREGEKLAGLLAAAPQEWGWELHLLAAVPELRGRGIGEGLIASLEEKLLPGSVLAAGTPDAVPDGIAFYESCGFLPAGVSKGFYEREYFEDVTVRGLRCTDRIYLQKRVGAPVHRVQVRPERAEEFPALDRLVDHAFGRREEADLIARLRRDPVYLPELAFTALQEGVPAGHGMFTALTIGGEPSLALAPLAVEPLRQRQGVGSALVVHGLLRARELGYGSAVVLGDPAFYRRFGFRPAFRRGITAPFGDREHLMVCELRPGGLDGVTGEIVYGRAFAV